MMLNKNDQDRVTQLLTDAITVLCKNGLNYASHFSIEGLLGITLDEQEVFLVKIDETVRGESIAGTYKAPAPHSEPTQRTSTTSPRFRGRARGRTLVNSRGRFSFSNRKRSLFGGVVKPSTTNPLHAKSVNDGGGGEPPSKVRLQGNVTPRTTPAQRNDIIEIADEENGSSNGSQVPSDIKSEPPDFTHSMPADSTQEPDPKYALDSETSRNLTNYLDTLMTSHSAGRGGNAASSQAVGAPSSPAAAAGSSALSHIAHHTPPKSEPQPWDQQQFTSGSPPAHPQQANGIRIKSEPSEASEGGSTPNGPSTSNGSVSSQSDSADEQLCSTQDPVKNGLADPNTHSNLFQTTKLPLFTKIPSLPLNLFPASMVLDLAQAGLQSSSPGASNPSNPAVFPSGDQDLASFYNQAKFQFGNIKQEEPNSSDDYSANVPYLDPYTCRYCFKKCSGLSGLNKHVLHAHINPEEKPFQCLRCEKGFQSKALLNRHKKEVHLGIYPHHCKLCGKGFQKMSRMTTHMMLEHQCTCVVCGLCCTSKADLHKHLSEEHGQQPPGIEADDLHVDDE